MHYKIKGFTIFEIFITLIIVGILAVISITGFREIIQNNRAVTLSNEFIASLAFARSEAIKRASTVTVCPATNANALSCGNNGDWSNGWIIFVDTSNSGTIANSSNRLKVHDALQTGTLVTTTISRITYNSAGFATSGTGAVNLTAPGCTGTNGRQVTISSSGRTDVVEIGC